MTVSNHSHTTATETALKQSVCSAKDGDTIFYMTDRKCCRAEIHSGDVMLTAKPGDKDF